MGGIRRKRTKVDHPICPLHGIKMPVMHVKMDKRYHYCSIRGCPFRGTTKRIEIIREN
jgi:hypothetical protein